MKKVLFFLGASYIGGLERIAFDLMRGLIDRGIDVRCIINGWNDGSFTSMLEKEKIVYYEIKIGSLYLRKPLWTLGSLYHYPKAIFRINSILNELKPDVVLHYSYRIFFMIYPVVRSCRNYFHVHEQYRGFYYQKMSLPLMVKNVSLFIACSEFIKNKLIDSGADPEKVTFIHNGIEIVESDYSRKTGEVVQLGIVGQVIPRKGHHILIEALRMIHAEKWKFQLHIFGKGDEKYIRDLKKQIILYQLENLVLWHGFIDQRNLIYSRLDIVVVPTIDDEPFGLTALEPAQYKIPVIVSDVGGLPEIVRDGYNGFHFKNNDAQDLANQMKKFLSNPERVLLMGKKHYEEAHNRFRMEQMIKKFMQILR